MASSNPARISAADRSRSGSPIFDATRTAAE